MSKKIDFVTGLIISGAICISLLVGCKTQTESSPIEKLGYISNFNTETRSFDFDEVEWLTMNDSERIEELEIEDMPGGFYIHNPEPDTVNCTFGDETVFSIVDWETVGNVNTGLDEFIASYEIYSEYSPPYLIKIENGIVTEITERYVP